VNQRMVSVDGGGFAVTEPFEDVKSQVAAASAA
jgi:hypothetical protein